MSEPPMNDVKKQNARPKAALSALMIECGAVQLAGRSSYPPGVTCLQSRTSTIAGRLPEAATSVPILSHRRVTR